MKKVLFILGIILLFASCSSDDDEKDYFRVKGAEDLGIGINITLENDITMTTLNIESNINNWSLVKKDTREVYWSFDNDLTKPNKTLKVEGNGNKTVNIYLERNPNPSDRAAYIEVYYGGKGKRAIQIIQKGTGATTN